MTTVRTHLGAILAVPLLVASAVAAAGPASAATAAPKTVTVASLPANVSIAAADTVQVTVPNSRLCAAGATLNPARIPGNQDAVSVTVPAACTSGTLTATVKPTGSAKRNAVVKFSATKQGAMMVDTLVVRIAKPRPGKPS